jgi:hypothetical protein
LWARSRSVLWCSSISSEQACKTDAGRSRSSSRLWGRS